MINYEDIGNRIRAVRIEKGMTQEELAEAINVGPAHISHIENGRSIPSVAALVGIINALDCSADELLCGEVKKAKPYFDSWLSAVFADCSEAERKVVVENAMALKASLRKHYSENED